MATEVFLCYRRDDSAGYTGRIEDRLRRDLGDILFVDVDAVPLGVNFVKYLREEVARCAVLLAVIGSRWLDARDEDGKRRLDDSNDFVRVEIGAALQRNISVIPLLVDGVKIPRANQLPKDLKELAVRNALEVRHASFHSDMDKLIKDLKRQLAEARQQGEKERTRREAEAKRRADEEAKIFVSYRRLDNDRPPDRPNARGFVDYLLREVRYDLAQLGVPNEILWEDRLQIEPGDVWSEKIFDALNEADLFIAIVSKNYIVSPWCQTELRTIESRFKMLGPAAGARRIFRVDKHKVPEDEIPETLRRIQAVRFYGEDPATRVQDEYFWRGKVRDSRAYDNAVRELTLAICNRLEELGIAR
jgi:TIR domain